MQLDQESGAGGATRQITLRMDRALHTKLKHALTERDTKLQPLVTWLIEFWLNNPDFQSAAANLAKSPIGKGSGAVYSGMNAGTEVRRFAEIFAKIPGGSLVQRKAIEFLEAALALHESTALTRGNEEALYSEIAQKLTSASKTLESLRSVRRGSRERVEAGTPAKKRGGAKARGGAASPGGKEEATW